MIEKDNNHGNEFSVSLAPVMSDVECVTQINIEKDNDDGNLCWKNTGNIYIEHSAFGGAQCSFRFNCSADESWLRRNDSYDPLLTSKSFRANQNDETANEKSIKARERRREYMKEYRKRKREQSVGTFQSYVSALVSVTTVNCATNDFST